MLKISRTAALAAGLAIGALAPAWAAAQAVKLVYSTHITKGSTIQKLDNWYMEEVTKRSAGRITFEPYFAGALLSAPDTFPGLGRGAADIATGFPSNYNPKQYPLTNVTMPYLTDNPDAVTRAFTELAKSSAALREEYARQGTVLLYSVAPPENTIWSQKKLEVDALKGLRVRATGPIADVFGLMGATPVPMSFQEGVEALQRGAIDAFSSAPVDSAVNAGLPKVAKYVSDGGRMGVYAVTSTAMNKKKFDALPPDLRKVILDVAAELPGKYAEEMVAMSAEIVKKMAGTPVIVETSSPAEVKIWRAKTEAQVLERWLAAAGPAGRQFFDQYVPLVRKYEAGSSYKPVLDIYRASTGK